MTARALSMPAPRLRWALIPILLLTWWLALGSLVDDSVTMDEQNHIARGAALLGSGDPRLSLEHPPLVNILSALPLQTLSLTLPYADPSWEAREGWYTFARIFMWEVNDQPQKMVTLARIPIVGLTLLLGALGARFAAEVWRSAWAGVCAGALLLADPNILAHGRYATTDIGGTLGVFLAGWALWRLWRRPTARRWAFAALALGAAFAAKLSTLTFVPIFALWALTRPGIPWRRRLADLGRYLAAGVASIAVVWAVFAFEWGPMRFAGAPLATLNRFAGPMPTFWAGIEQILFLSGGGRPAYLLGRFSDTGFRAYFPVAFLVKTPLATLGLLLAAGVWLRRDRTTRARAAWLALPAVAYFGISLTSSLNIGYRHLLPLLPWLAVTVAGLAAQPGLRRRIALGGVAALLVTTLFIYPHFIGTFNVAAGGPAQGWRILSDSNVDWGQDLIRLRRWMDENGVDRVKLGYFGSADITAYNIPYDPLPGEPAHRDLWWNVPFDRTQPEPGVYVISAALLGEPPLRTEEKTVYAWFRARSADARVGAFLIYVVA